MICWSERQREHSLEVVDNSKRRVLAGRSGAGKKTMDRLEGQIAIITGAGQGIGRAVALGLAREGAHVVIAEMDEENALKVERELAHAGKKCLAVPTDVSREDSVQAMVRRCLDEFGSVDILVNNAGIYRVSPVEDMAEEEWDRVIATNLLGAFLCARAVVPALMERRRGRIISVSSAIALKGAKNSAHYAASKAGIIGLTKALALELAPYGITANAICPGLTDTAFPRRYRTDAEIYAAAERIPLGRIGKPEDVAGVAIFLASDAASFITGQALVANGGEIMR